MDIYTHIHRLCIHHTHKLIYAYMIYIYAHILYISLKIRINFLLDVNVRQEFRKVLLVMNIFEVEWQVLGYLLHNPFFLFCVDQLQNWSAVTALPIAGSFMGPLGMSCPHHSYSIFSLTHSLLFSFLYKEWTIFASNIDICRGEHGSEKLFVWGEVEFHWPQPLSSFGNTGINMWWLQLWGATHKMCGGAHL